MTVKKNEERNVSAITHTEIQAALEQILTSSMFINSPRASRLLRFLVEKTIAGSVRDTSEYAIGIEVFDRNYSNYSTNEDPIVRVQVGRLREKLKVYYASFGFGSDIEISIPLGCYKPAFRRISEVENIGIDQYNLLRFNPFKCISLHNEGLHFTQGLNEELKHQLFKAFGKIFAIHSCLPLCNAGNKPECLSDISNAATSHLLEGSIRVAPQSIRASIQLLDTSAGCITWSEQFDRDVFFDIKHQEELAISICAALKGFFTTNKGDFIRSRALI